MKPIMTGLWLRWLRQATVIGLCLWPMLLQGAEAGTTTGPLLQVSPESYNFGIVGRHDGRVEATFTLRNHGDAPLLIQEIRTSCKCMTATLVVAQKKSPLFDMHGSDPSWSETLKPGQEATLLVGFDPNFYGPQGLGVQEAGVHVISNDSQTPVLSLVLNAVVVENPGMARGGEQAGAKIGPSLQVSPAFYDFGIIGLYDDRVQTTFRLRNGGDAPLHILRIRTS